LQTALRSQWDKCQKNNSLFASPSIRRPTSEDIFYEEIFNRLPKEKQSVIIGRKADFAQKAEIRL
jgi:hypothetical protein